MFGGLTKTSSRIAIAAALGLTLGGFAFKATPAQAADLGGDCCADLEERVAELEATTVRKGNKKVSVTLSGWVVKSMNWWDDGEESSFVVGDKDADLTSRFAITGSAQIAPGWSGGFNITITTPGFLADRAGRDADVFGLTSNQFNEFSAVLESINTLYSYIYVKSDTWGALNWGYLSPASDNKAVLADISGTIIESNGVWFEGAGFFLRPNGGGGGLGGTSGLIWADFIRCQGLGTGIGVDCMGDPQPAVRYDSPTWGGFRFETSYGTMEPGRDVVDGTPDSNFWDIAAIYTADWNSIKLSAAATYTFFETGAITQDEVNLFQAGASIMHKPSGLGIYGMYQTEESDGNSTATIGINSVTLESITVSNPPPNLNFDLSFLDGNVLVLDRGNQSTDAWYIKPFWRHTWGAANGVGLGTLGATTFYGEFGQYNDQFDNGLNLCSFDNPAGSNLGDFCADVPTVSVLGGLITASAIPGDVVKGAFVDSSEAQRFGLGVVQEIDAAAMHLWARWQHQELDASITGFTLSGQGCFGGLNPGACTVQKEKINQSFDDWDLFQIGGIIFF